LIAQGLITTELLASQPLADSHSAKGINVVWLLASHEQWGLIETLIAQGHITTQLLASQPLADNHPDQGKNVVWLLASHGRWDLLGTLIGQGKITTQLLLSKAQQGDNTKRNVLSFLPFITSGI
jgi:hypothetical protein